MKRKGDVELDEFTIIIIGLGLLVLSIALIFILKEKNEGAIEFLRRLLSFGR